LKQSQIFKSAKANNITKLTENKNYAENHTEAFYICQLKHTLMTKYSDCITNGTLLTHVWQR